MKRVLSWAALYAVSVFAVVAGAWPAPAQAAGPVPVVSECNSGWYVNADEADLLPKQVETGLLFDGKSIVHHAAEPMALDAVSEASLKAIVVTGSAPLVKLETSKPYSTVNVLPSGLAWSSKIPAAEEGGQNKPVSLADLGKLAPYTAESRVVTFGAGYANDSGNKAIVTEITYGSTVKLACPKPSASPSPSASPTVKPTPTVSPTVKPTPTTSASATPTGKPTASASQTASESAMPVPSASTSLAAVDNALPVTGSPLRTAFGIGVGLLVGGAILFIFSRKRRV